MEYFLKLLTFLRKSYNTKGRQYLYLWGSVLIGSLIASVLVDVFVPFGARWNLIRTVLVVPFSFSIFALGYALGLELHRFKSKDRNWVPYRNRFSPLWRLRIAAILLAIGFVLVYASSESPVYTTFASLIIAGVLGLAAFVRKTSQELKREELGIPDARDVSYDSEVRKLQAKRKKAMAEREEKRKTSTESKGRFKAFRPLANKQPEDEV